MIMRSVVLVLLVVVCRATSVAEAGDAGCLNGSLPNILGLGKCLGGSGDLCTSNTDGAVAYIGQLLGCVLEGIEDLDVGTQLYLLLQLLADGLNRSGLGILIGVINTVCDFVHVDCSAINVNATAFCGDPFVLNLPVALDVGQCWGNGSLACDNGEVVAGSAVKVLVDVTKCILENLSNENLETVLKSNICSVLNILYRLLGNPAILQEVISAISAILGINCSTN